MTVSLCLSLSLPCEAPHISVLHNYLLYLPYLQDNHNSLSFEPTGYDDDRSDLSTYLPTTDWRTAQLHGDGVFIILDYTFGNTIPILLPITIDNTSLRF